MSVIAGHTSSNYSSRRKIVNHATNHMQTSSRQSKRKIDYDPEAEEAMMTSAAFSLII